MRTRLWRHNEGVLLRNMIVRGFAEPKAKGGKPAAASGKAPSGTPEIQTSEGVKIVDIPDNALYNLSKKQHSWEIYINKLNYIARSVNQKYSKKLSEITILPQNRIVLPIVRMRKDSDTVISLKDSGLAPCYLILWRDDNKQELLHFVLEQKQIHALKKLKDFKLRPIYIHTGTKEYRVLLEDIVTNPSKFYVNTSPSMDSQLHF